MKVTFSILQKSATEVCPTCGKTSYVTPGSKQGHVPWRHEYIPIRLACGHYSENTYDDDAYHSYNVELVNEQKPE